MPLVEPRPAPVHRLIRWHRLTLYVAGGLLLLTGASWLVVRYGIGSDADGLPSPLEAWSLRVHGLAAFGGVFALGVLAAAHVPQGWRLSLRNDWRSQRRTGSALCILGALLVVTGYLLFYFAPEAIRPALGWIHAGIGFVMAALVASHRRGV